MSNAAGGWRDARSSGRPQQAAERGIPRAGADAGGARDGAQDGPAADRRGGNRLPGADGPEAFWRLLEEGRHAIREVPPGRWDAEAHYDPDPLAPGKMYTRHGGFLPEVDGLDAAFFGISPREALTMDPQQRLFLEVAWEALEDAGMPADRLGGSSTGVFLGICNNDYAQAVPAQGAAAIDAYCGTGSTYSVAAGRLSYILGLQGPCLAVDTACSSSLVALDLACQSLRAGRCEQALAGGVNLLLRPESSIYFCKVRALSPDGICKTFDAAADGYGRGEGCGVVVLKRLDDALRDGDSIRAVVLGSAVNHDGRSNGLTAPNGQSQEAAIRAALADAGVAPLAVGYVEAHGTGTPLGDPIELLALARAYGEGRAAGAPLLVGSVKTNIGHLEGAAGIAGLIKTVLALEHGAIPPHLNLHTPNRHVRWGELPLAVPRTSTPWPEAGRVAAVSAFGFSGTNAHVILAAAPPAAASVAGINPFELVTISARSAPALRALAGRFADYLRRHGPAAAGVAYTANTGRARFRYRAAVTAAPEAMAAALDAVAQDGPAPAPAGAVPGTAFLFAAEGAQYAGMGRQLYDALPVFRAVIDRCGSVLESEYGLNLHGLLWDANDDAIRRTDAAQPAIYALSCGLAAVWRSWGIEPACMIGYGVGEYAAAWDAKVFSLEDGLRLAAMRGRMMQALDRNGTLAVVEAGEARLLENTPHLSAGLAVEFEAYAARFTFAAPRTGLISSVTGAVMEGTPDARYWRRHANEQVRFAAAVAAAGAQGCKVFIELGPQPVLQAIAQQGLREIAEGTRWLPSLRRGGEDMRQMLESLGALFVAGAPGAYAAYQRHRGPRLSLPHYPFERQRYWLDSAAALDFAGAKSEAADMPPVAAPDLPLDIPEVIRALREAPAASRFELLSERIGAEVRRVLRLSAAPDPKQGFFELGMDSLMAVEMQARLEAGLGQKLPATAAFDYPNINQLAGFILREMFGSPGSMNSPAQLAPAQSKVAIVGMGCRFPGGANDPAAFAAMLQAGSDAVRRVPPARWAERGWYDADMDAAGRSYCRDGGFLDQPVDGFDARLFGISPREAVAMDPQHRLLLEVAWEALEYAGIAPDRLGGMSAGTFIGINANDYARLLGRGGELQLDAYSFTGNTFSVAAGRLSHVLGLQGPSVAVDTACSSSLVAVHLACQSLQLRECDLALAGGVNLMLAPDAYVALSRMRALAPDGRCKSFDVAADGYGRGEGCGIVVLKRLEDALAGGDNVLAVIHGSATNHDGPSSGLTVPNGPAQQTLIRNALARARLAPEAIGYLEAHGTGTPLGDPIELGAAAEVLARGRPPARPLLVGSVKTNIGHLEAAAGIAGLIKVVLSLRHETIPAHLHLRELNPRIGWDGLAVQIPRLATPWPAGAEARFAGVSSFGMSGTNAHVILGEAPVVEGARSGVERSVHVVSVSARGEAALAEVAARYAAALPVAGSVADFAYTANTGRAVFEHRLAVVAGGSAELAAGLALAASGGAGPGIFRGVAGGTPPRVAFLFTGQGAQYAGMGRALYDTQPVFRAALERCAELLAAELPVPLLAVLYGAEGGLIGQTRYTQPALFALEYALAMLWASWGVAPAVVLGHSLGGYVAACVAGVLTLEDALRLVALRARLMQGLPAGGAMAAVRAPAARVTAALAAAPAPGTLALAAENGANDVVVAGEAAALAALCRGLAAEGIACQNLAVSHAFHSPLMAPILAEFGAAAAAVAQAPPRLRWIRDLDGELAAGAPEPGYWAAHLRQPVRFHAALQTLRAQDCQIVVEVGPQPALQALGQEPRDTRLWLASLRRGRDAERTMLESLAQMYTAGATLDWAGFDQPFSRRRAVLPTYPFQRRRFWVETTANKTQTKAAPNRSHPYLGERLASPLEVAQFVAEADLRDLTMVRDHRIFGLPWVNLVTYLEWAAAAAREVLGPVPVALVAVDVPRALVLSDHTPAVLHVALSPVAEGWAFRIDSHERAPGDPGGWRLHAKGCLDLSEGAPPAPAPSLEAVRARCGAPVAASAFYAAMERHGVALGPACRWLEQVWRGHGEALGRIRSARPAELDARLVLDMGALDACFQLLGAVLPSDAPHDFVFAGLGRLTWHGKTASSPLWAHAVLTAYDEAAGTLTGRVCLFDEDARVLAVADAGRLERVRREAALAGAGPPGFDAASLLGLGDEEAVGLLVAYLTAELAYSLRVPATDIDTHGPLAAQLDSLIAVELNSRVEQNMQLRVPVASLLDGASLTEVAQRLWIELQPSELDDAKLEEMLDALERLPEAADAELSAGSCAGRAA